MRKQLSKFLAIVQIEKTRFFAFAILRCCKGNKKVFSQDDRAFEIKQLKLNIDALKMYEQMRLKIDKKFRTSINSKFIGSYKKKKSVMLKYAKGISTTPAHDIRKPGFLIRFSKKACVTLPQFPQNLS